MLTNKFEGLEIKKFRVHEFMRNECNLSMKQEQAKKMFKNATIGSSSGAIRTWVFQETVFLSMKLVLISIGGQAEHGHLWFGDVFGRRFQTFRND
jgi:hypothetical protein